MIRKTLFRAIGADVKVIATGENEKAQLQI
jgi:hypothetical protein